MTERVQIHRIPTGVPGLDDVLGGGIPEYSFNLVAGGPGCGKTTLAHQIMFANATPERPALYISVLGEPPIKMLRYQQQFSFFNVAQVGEAIRFLHLGQEALDGGLSKVLSSIVREVESTNPSLVVVDSFRAVMQRTHTERDGELDLQSFVQRLALHLTSSEATTFLLGEYLEPESDNNAVFTVADGILWLHQAIERNSMVRKLQVVKIRGQAQLPGLHTARITESGMRVFPRLSLPEQRSFEECPPKQSRLSTGVPDLDEMMGGGIPAGYTTLIAGPSGSGKTVLSNQFLLEGGRLGERGIIAIFEKRPSEYLETTPHGQEFARLVREKKLEVLYLRPLDLSLDETLVELREAVVRTGAKRAVIDSLSGLELALAPTFREDFRESLYRMLGSLTALGVTVMATVELTDSFTDFPLSPQAVSFLTDAVLVQRYVEVSGQLKRVMSVVKVRASQHSKDLREYEITAGGLQILPSGSLVQYEGLLTGGARDRRQHDAERDKDV
jgi:circadian clock protein KaiC